ncbi:glycosyltransferase family 1 protein [Pelagibius sp. CAU 1746]|uniref:glycosyltransferase family 4 protein n=1 Tax=Pelagibius sp. CAU 1746 TaxID=3140370 RepID=UPI00325C3236
MKLSEKTLDQILLAVPLIGGQNWLGGENYIRNILYALATLPPAERPRVRLTSTLGAEDSVVDGLLSFDFVDLHPMMKFARINAATRFVFRAVNWLVRRALRRSDSIEYHDADLVFPVINFTPGTSRSIYWIGDFQEIFLPELFTEELRDSRNRKNSAIIASTNVLVLSSQAALEDLKAHFPDVRANIHVWRFSSLPQKQAAGGREPHEAYGLPKKFVYIPNQFWAHKNHEVAFRALGRLRDRAPDLCYVCTGSTYEHRVKGHFEKLRALLQEEGCEDRVILLGIVPRADQIEIMRHAALILQPSLFEGWSTVVEDARALGRPILLSNLPVHLEQDPPRAVYFNPEDPVELAEKLERAWSQSESGPDAEAEAEAVRVVEARQSQAGRELANILREAARQGAGA